MAEMTDREKRFPLKENYSMDELRAILAFLRSEEGCPWDRAQSHESIQGNMLEEAYEAVDAIQSGDPEKLVEELGDVLMQVVFHAGIAEEADDFSFDQVVSGICRKLISRHTHLFGSDKAETPELVLRTWEKNKRKEKGHRRTVDAMRDLPRGMPALTRAYKLQKKAADIGFDWPSLEGAKEKIKEEYDEFLAELDRGDEIRAREEAGDLLFAVVNILRMRAIDPEAALTGCSERFIRRFSAMEEAADREGSSLARMSLEEMDGLWDEAKRLELSGGRAYET